MQLPPGRTMEQCIQVTEQMFQGPMRIPDLKRKPVGDLLDKPSKRLAVASPMEPPPPLASASQGPSAYANPMSTDERWPGEWHGVQRLSEPKPAARSAASAS
uniref:Uncharacterized protein n=1 Tax=Colletotrichum fructicola (strain Nara gc5) TaxID=1213859 RepID=L2G3R1_COLFN